MLLLLSSYLPPALPTLHPRACGFPQAVGPPAPFSDFRSSHLLFPTPAFPLCHQQRWGSSLQCLRLLVWAILEAWLWLGNLLLRFLAHRWSAHSGSVAGQLLFRAPWVPGAGCLATRQRPSLVGCCSGCTSAPGAGRLAKGGSKLSRRLLFRAPVAPGAGRRDGQALPLCCIVPLLLTHIHARSQRALGR